MAKINRNKGIEKSKEAIQNDKEWIARNSKFDPSYCEKIIEFGKKGKSFAQFCSSLNVSDRTFRSWLELNERFNEAKGIALEHCKAYWDTMVEAYIVESHEGEKLNSAHLKWVSAQRFPARTQVKLRDPGNAYTCFEDINQHVADGKISVDDATKFSNLILGMIKAKEFEQLVSDVEELKRLAKESQSERLGETETSISSETGN